MNKRTLKILRVLTPILGVVFSINAANQAVLAESSNQSSKDPERVRFVAYLADSEAMKYVEKWKKRARNYSSLQNYYLNVATANTPVKFVLLWNNKWIDIDTPAENQNASLYFKGASALPTLVLARATKTANGFKQVEVIADLNNQIHKPTSFFERYPHANTTEDGIVIPKINRLFGKYRPPATPSLQSDKVINRK